jgi:hypothetical protein
LDRLPNVSAPNTSNNSTEFASDDPEEDSFEPDELAQEQSFFVPSPFPGPTEVDTVCVKMRSEGLVNNACQRLS